MKLTKQRLEACVYLTMFKAISPHIKDDSAWKKDGIIMKIINDFFDSTIENSIREPVKEYMKSNPEGFLDMVERGKKCKAMWYKTILSMKYGCLHELTPEERCFATGCYTDNCRCWECSHTYECSASDIWGDNDEKE